MSQEQATPDGRRDVVRVGSVVSCRIADCQRGGVGIDGRCPSHIDDRQLRARLAYLSLDARDARIGNDLLQKIFAAAPRDEAGMPQLHRASFAGASFGAGASFEGASFAEAALFDGASFGERANFADARFGERASFSGASFGERANFADASFGAGANFERATFGDHASFNDASFGAGANVERATFGDHASFNVASFGAGASFLRALFGDHANFNVASFGARASFLRASFGDHAKFIHATFGERAWFDFATFGKRAEFAGASFGEGALFVHASFGEEANFADASFGERLVLEIAVDGDLSLDGARLARPRRIAIGAKHVGASGLQLSEGAALSIWWAAIDLSETAFPALTTLAPPSDETVASLMRERWVDSFGRSPPDDPRPRLVSLVGADVGNLVLSDVDLSSCRFQGALNLDRLRLQGATGFARAPRLLGAGRETIAEEHRWRATDWGRSLTGRLWRRLARLHPAQGHWYPEGCRAAGEPAAGAAGPAPGEIAPIYRALRKAREDAKDEPGAADLYYGEMEMRRHAAPRPGVERSVLWLYWAVSGYGLRASRALALLALVIVGFAIGLNRVGFEESAAGAGEPSVGEDEPTFGTALLRSAEGVANLLRGGAGEGFTEAGQGMLLALRFLGPLLIALAVLAFRARVRR